MRRAAGFKQIEFAGYGHHASNPAPGGATTVESRAAYLAYARTLRGLPRRIRAAGQRLMRHYLDVTNPDLVLIGMDVYWAHVARHQHRWRYDWEGNRVEDI